ncbi:MAG: autotransporter domain-containing protein, partial [Chthoniobacterales bacterium]|nr:autotransporter domain-containing protein [Chthoniobacterales bacterium]
TNTGTLGISSSNSFAGPVVLNGGTLNASNNYALGSGTAINVNSNATLNVASNNNVGAITIASGTLSGSGTLSTTGVNVSGSSNTISLNLVNSGGLTNTGALALSGSNTFGGPITLNGGNVIEGAINALGNGTALNINSNSLLTLAGIGTNNFGAITLSNGAISGGAFTNNGITASGTSSISSSILGGAGVTNNGGTLTLSGSNSYTGGTVINSSTLALSGAGTLGAATNTTIITNDGVLNLGGTTQQQGVISMSGCSITNGTVTNTQVLFTGRTNTVSASIVGASSVVSILGTNTLSGTGNTYTGGTHITNSEIIVASGSSLGASTNVLSMSNGTLNLSGGTVTNGVATIASSTITNGNLKLTALVGVGAGATNNISANIGGTGSITNNSGVMILSGNNTYTGTTMINGGAVNVDSTTGLGTSATVLNGGGLVLDANATAGSLNWATNTSRITITTPGTSKLSVNGLNFGDATSTYTFVAGSLDNNLNEVLSYTNGTNVNIDNLILFGQADGSYTFSTNTIAGETKVYYQLSTNGTYYVTGTNNLIDANFTKGNVVYTAGSVLTIATNGILNVTTNYTSSPTGTLECTFGSSAVPITVGGTAALDGKLIVHYANGTYDGNVNQLMTAGSLTGKFSSIIGDNPERYRYRGVCVGDPEYYIVTAPANYTIVAVNQNQHNVASALNSFINASGDYGTVSADLDYLTDPQYPNVFNQISPQLYTTLATVAFNSAVAQYNEMVQRLGNIRVAGVGFSSMGMNDSPIMDDNKNPKSNGKDILIPSVDNHWGCFVDGNGIFANVNIGNQLPGYSAEGGGVTIGADYKWNNEFSTGLYVGYEGFQSKQSGGNFISDNGSRFGAFGTYQHGGFFANGILGGDSHSYQVNRSIQFQGPSSIAPALNRTASSAPTAGELDSMLAAGYDVKRGNFTFGPITSLQYTYFGLQPFTESGANSLDLSVASANDNSMVYSLGSHCFYTWQASKNILVVPQINLGWQHEFLQNPYTLNSTFGNGSSFAYNSTTPLRDSLYTGVGFTVNLDKKYDASFFYNASACNPSIMSQNFFVSLGTKF